MISVSLAERVQGSAGEQSQGEAERAHKQRCTRRRLQRSSSPVALLAAEKGDLRSNEVCETCETYEILISSEETRKPQLSPDSSLFPILPISCASPLCRQRPLPSFPPVLNPLPSFALE